MKFISLAKGISPKMNVIVQLEFELVYYDVTVQHFSHYTTAIWCFGLVRILRIL